MMADKIEIGDYIRYKGNIYKADKIEYPTEKSYGYIHYKDRENKNVTYCIEFEENKNGELISSTQGKITYSKNQIDLIEAGDILEYKVENLNIPHISKVKEYFGVEGFSLKQIEILKILTKEQFEQNCYKVGGEDE